MYWAMRKSKRFLHWTSGQDWLAVLKPTPLLPLVPIRSFFWRVDYALEGSDLPSDARTFFFNLFGSVKLFLSLSKAVRLCKVPQDLNN